MTQRSTETILRRGEAHSGIEGNSGLITREARAEERGV